MTPRAGIDAAALSVLLDLRHPLAYLALHPTLAFAESLAVAVNWLPLEVPTLGPPSSPREGDDRGIRHRRHRARALAREIETYAAAQGLVLRDFYRHGSARIANLGWLWLREHRPDALQRYLVDVFRAYWSVAFDPADPAQVASMVTGAGGDAAAFLAWAEGEGPRVASALADELRERGLFQVPAFVVGDEVFYGRQHLPMIRWILEGRSGPVPI